MKQQEQQALVDWLAEQNFTVFGTLKFNDGYNIYDTLAKKLVRRYFNTLDKLYYGNEGISNNVRHERAVFLRECPVFCV